MKIINEKGKLFGIINVVDFLVLLAAIVVIGGLGGKLLGPKVAEAVSPTVTLTSQMRVRGVSPVVYNDLQEHTQVGKHLVSGNDYTGAVITDMWLDDYEIQIQCADGRIVNAVDPVKKDVIFMIESQVAEGTPAPKIGTQEVRMGRTFILKTNDFETTANIELVVMGE